MDSGDDPTLSVVGPDSISARRSRRLSGEDARKLALIHQRELCRADRGPQQQVQWSRSGPSEVMLYIPYKLVVVPARRDSLHQ